MATKTVITTETTPICRKKTRTEIDLEKLKEDLKNNHSDLIGRKVIVAQSGMGKLIERRGIGNKPPSGFGDQTFGLANYLCSDITIEILGGGAMVPGNPGPWKACDGSAGGFNKTGSPQITVDPYGCPENASVSLQVPRFEWDSSEPEQDMGEQGPPVTKNYKVKEDWTFDSMHTDGTQSWPGGNFTPLGSNKIHKTTVNPKKYETTEKGNMIKKITSRADC